jgi:tetratricopeptide (TPR) repeat protein
MGLGLRSSRCFLSQGDPAIDALADSIENAWNSGDYKRAASLFHSAHKISASEFRNSYRLVALLADYLSSAKLYREGLLAADILVAVHPNLFQAHLARARALTMLRLWDAAVQQLAVVRRLQPSLQFLTAYEREIYAAASSDAADSQGTRPLHYEEGDSNLGAASSSHDDRSLDSWASVLRGLGQGEFVPYVVFDVLTCLCCAAFYAYKCKVESSAAKVAKASNALAAAPALIQPTIILRRSRP